MSFRFIDLFAGIGGIRIPFEEIGGTAVFSSEWDKFSQITYEANHGDKPHGDITLVPPEEIPEFDLLLAGFPCQPFSNAGLKRGFDDTRGTLFFSIAEIAAHHRPKVLFLENVKGLVSHDKGRTFSTILRVLEDELGYKVFHQIHNARDFGVPQNRERIFIVALRDHDEFQFSEAPKPPTKLGDILEPEGSVDEKYTISNKIWASHQARRAAHAARGNGFGYSLFDSSSPYTSTISARYYKDGAEILVAQEGKNPRRLTPREAARLQGFPEEFVIPVSDAQAYKQFGNSVAVPAIRALAQSLAPILGASSARRTWEPAVKPEYLWDEQAMENQSTI